MVSCRYLKKVLIPLCIQRKTHKGKGQCKSSKNDYTEAGKKDGHMDGWIKEKKSVMIMRTA